MEEVFTKEHCNYFPAFRPLNGLVMVLNTESIIEEERLQRNQLYMCLDNEIDPPDYAKSAVHVICLNDGESYSWNIEDFLGVLKDDLLPEWALEVKKTVPEPLTSQEIRFAKSEVPPFTMPFDCRILTEYDNVLLMARKTEQSIDYITYLYDVDKQGVNTGRYFDDSEDARLDFCVRSGLMPHSEVFSKEEKLAMGAACQYVLDYSDLTEEEAEYTQDVLNKIDYDALLEEVEEMETDYER